ncbi:MAG: hypothetical protein EP338_01565 [Bacteroidetes bacterium]|nr:MAG: hypothetical protein EP338_01565 [Bacteroidota bacterium]
MFNPIKYGLLIFILLALNKGWTQNFNDLLKKEAEYRIQYPEHLHFYDRGSQCFSSTHFFYLSVERDTLFYHRFSEKEKRFVLLDDGYWKTILYKDGTLSVTNSIRIRKNVLTCYAFEGEELIPKQQKTTRERTLEASLSDMGGIRRSFGDYEQVHFEGEKRSVCFPNRYFFLGHYSPTDFIDFTDSNILFVDPISSVFHVQRGDSSWIDSSFFVEQDCRLLDSILGAYDKRNPKAVFDVMDRVLFENQLIWSIRFLNQNRFVLRKTKPDGEGGNQIFLDVFEIRDNKIHLIRKDIALSKPKDKQIIGTDLPEFIGFFQHNRFRFVDGKLMIIMQGTNFRNSGMEYGAYQKRREDYFRENDPIYQVLIYEVD